MNTDNQFLFTVLFTIVWSLATDKTYIITIRNNGSSKQICQYIWEKPESFLLQKHVAICHVQSIEKVHKQKIVIPSSGSGQPMMDTRSPCYDLEEGHVPEHNCSDFNILTYRKSSKNN